MSRTIKHYARKVATKAASEDSAHRRAGINEGGWRQRFKAEPSGRWELIWANSYKAQFSGRRRRRLYAEARKAKASIELPGRPSHDDAGDTAGFTCLYG